MENVTFVNNSVIKNTNEYEHSDWTRYTFISLMVLLAIIGIPGNAIIIIVVKNIRAKSTTDWYVLFIAGFDLVSSTVNTTCYIIRFIPAIWALVASKELCRLHTFSLYTTNIASNIFLMAIAFDRQRKTFALSSDLPSAITKAKNISICITVFSCLFGCISPVFITLDPSTKQCFRAVDHILLRNITNGILALMFVSFTAVAIVCYTRIAIKLHRNHRKWSEARVNIVKHKPPKEGQVRNNISRNQSLVDRVNNPGTSPHSSLSIDLGNVKLHSQVVQNDNVHELSTSAPLTNVSRQALCTKENDRKTHIPKVTPMCGTSALRSNVPANERKPTIIATNTHKKRKQVNRTTLLMFLIILIHTCTWLTFWTLTIYDLKMKTPATGGLFVARTIYLVNAMANPVLYMIMSSKFKENAKKLFCRKYE